jgi:hypothetical protein
MSDMRRLNLRWHGIIRAQQDLIGGRHVVEAGCWDGRWLFAALSAGARHVTGTEKFPEIADAARRNLRSLGISADRYTILTGDFFEVAGEIADDIETLLILGFIGMGLPNFAIFDFFQDSSATAAVFDDWVIKSERAFIELWDADSILHTIPSDGAITLLGSRLAPRRADFDYSDITDKPSDAGLSLFQSKGLASLADDPIIDYKLGARMTARFTK